MTETVIVVIVGVIALVVGFVIGKVLSKKDVQGKMRKSRPT